VRVRATTRNRTQGLALSATVLLSGDVSSVAAAIRVASRAAASAIGPEAPLEGGTRTSNEPRTKRITVTLDVSNSVQFMVLSLRPRRGRCYGMRKAGPERLRASRFGGTVTSKKSSQRSAG
jgi:hypothetical protein